jgi:hypothetical protein
VSPSLENLLNGVGTNAPVIIDLVMRPSGWAGVVTFPKSHKPHYVKSRLLRKSLILAPLQPPVILANSVGS